MTKEEAQRLIPDFEVLDFRDKTHKYFYSPDFRGQELLIGSNTVMTELTLASKTDKNKVFNCEVATRGEIDIEDLEDGTRYSDGDQNKFPYELSDLIKQDKHWDWDTNIRFNIISNNWYDLYISDKDGTEIINSVLETPGNSDDNLVAILNCLEHDLNVVVNWDRYKPEHEFVRVYDIKWDIDRDSDKDFLKNEIYLPIADFPASISSLDIEDWIANHISDEIGFCHEGFRTDFDGDSLRRKEIIDLVQDLNFPLKKKIGLMSHEDVAKVVNEIIEFEEFEIKYDSSKELPYSLVDTTGTNLGNIEGENFYDLGSVLDRLDTYHKDYIWDACSWEDTDENVKKENFYANFLQFGNWDKLEEVSKEPLKYKIVDKDLCVSDDRNAIASEISNIKQENKDGRGER